VVTRSSATYAFEHFPVVTDANGVWNGPTSAAPPTVTSSFATVILENGYLRVTLLPEYGGRILSIIHKPTQQELLYQNPVGTPYLMNEDIFYYDYLVILGGIFPSFPEPEHGRHWNRPYALEVVSESEDAVTVRMSIQDDLDLVAGVPSRYEVPRTDIRVDLDVTLRAGCTGVELTTTLTNTNDAPVPAFEYWTVTTLAPGSTPGMTAIGHDARILADMQQVHLLESSWSWFGAAETRVSGEIFEWNNLSYFDNWVEQGTAFANPSYMANWSGLINGESDVGVLRVSDNDETPGLKLWTFGRDSINAELQDAEDWLRPTIEMWHGVTPEFWQRDSMAAGEVRSWTDHYLPTFGLREVTAASPHGAVQLTATPIGTDTTLRAVASLTWPGRTVVARLLLDAMVVAQTELVVPADGPVSLDATVPTSMMAGGAQIEAEYTSEGELLLQGELTVL
jgi:hypothetical protein